MRNFCLDVFYSARTMHLTLPRKPLLSPSYAQRNTQSTAQPTLTRATQGRGLPCSTTAFIFTLWKIEMCARSYVVLDSGILEFPSTPFFCPLPFSHFLLPGSSSPPPRSEEPFEPSPSPPPPIQTNGGFPIHCPFLAPLLAPPFGIWWKSLTVARNKCVCKQPPSLSPFPH